MTKVTIEIEPLELAQLITKSVRSCFAAHATAFVENGRVLAPDVVERRMHELGNNTAQAIVVRAEAEPTVIADHDYLSAGDTPYANGDRAYTGCYLCNRPRNEHAK